MQAEQKDHMQDNGKWGGWYAFVILFLVLQIVLFSLFTRYFS